MYYFAAVAPPLHHSLIRKKIEKYIKKLHGTWLYKWLITCFQINATAQEGKILFELKFSLTNSKIPDSSPNFQAISKFPDIP